MEPSKSKKMTVDQVRRLIAARIACNHLFTRKFFDRQEAWRKIQKQAGLHDFTPEQVKIKWGNLTQHYKKLIAPPTGGATENGEQLPEDWEYFDQLHEFMSNQHTINPPLVVNSCGVIVQNSMQLSAPAPTLAPAPVPVPASQPTQQHIRPGSAQDETMCVAGPSYVTSGRSYALSPVSSPEPVSSSPQPEAVEGYERGKRKRYSQQDMFEHFVQESKRKKKEGKKFFTLLKCFAQAQNVELPNFDSSSSESDSDY